MNIEESIQQIETLIEAWQLDEADLNQTDINAMQTLLKENEELKKQLENNSKINVADHKYASECEDKVIVLETQQKDLKKQVEDLFSENRNLRKKLENCMTFEDYKYTLNKKIKLEIQQKEFIKYLEDESKEVYRDGGLRQNIFRQILQKYEEIIGDVKNENNNV